MINSEEFEVEAILKKRMNKEKVEYFLKWADYPAKHNRWVPVNIMSCPDLLFEFEKSQFKDIIGVKITPLGFDYAVRSKATGNTFELIPSAKMLNMWPNELIQYLENWIVFEMPQATLNDSPNIQLSRNVEITGFPDEIIGCTNFNGNLKYLCKWDNHSAALQLVSAHHAKTNFGHLVVRFLEPNLECQPVQYPNDVKFMSRALKDAAKSENISVDPKVKIVRHLGLEKLMVTNSAALITNRHATIDPGTKSILKTCKNIPFGARGRKRQWKTVAFIGIQPNLDGRQLTDARPSINSSSSGITVRSSNDNGAGTSSGYVVMPGRRTYSRATSTPLPRTNRFDATISSDSDDNTIEQPSLGVTFGQLHYSSSE